MTPYGHDKSKIYYAITITGEKPKTANHLKSIQTKFYGQNGLMEILLPKRVMETTLTLFRVCSLFSLLQLEDEYRVYNEFMHATYATITNRKPL